jgi:hypothetical protein
VLAAAFATGGCFRTVMGRGLLLPGLAESDTVELKLVLIGDAGLPARGGEPVLRALRHELARDPQHSLVVYLGDNVYPRGMVLDSTARERRENERIRGEQLAPLLELRVPGVMIPGNHDWAAGTAAAWEAVRAQGIFVDGRGGGLVTLLPGHACPGPVTLDVGSQLRLIVLDTQWWLQTPEPRPEGDNAPDCRARTPAQVVDSLRADLAGAGGRRTVVVGHHPLVSGGRHGGYFDWPTYLFPLHPWARQAGLFAKQDVTGSEYRAMIAALTRAFAEHPPLVYAAGHEHNLQLLRADPARYQVVSGAGIYNHSTPVRALRSTLYANRASGWASLAFLRDGRVRLAFHVVQADGSVSEDFSMWLDVPPPPAGSPAVSAIAPPAPPAAPPLPAPRTP